MSTERMAVIAYLVKHHFEMSTTRLMKYLFFLQEARGVPLGYHFELYIYGPKAPEVLNDVAEAIRLGYIRRAYKQEAHGSYEVFYPDNCDALLEAYQSFLERYEPHLRWVLLHFKDYTGSDLIMASIMVRADKEFTAKNEILLEKDLVELMSEFNLTIPKKKIEDIKNHLMFLGVLQGVKQSESISLRDG